MAGEQLERSILERKERDELHAIAAAMSLAPRPRSKKADIIDLILRATGVDPDQEAAQASNGNGNGNGAVHENGNGAHGAVEAPEAPAGPRRRTSTRRSRTATAAEAVAEATAELSGEGEAVAEREEHVAAPASDAAAAEVAVASEAPSAEPIEGNGRGRRAGYRTRGEGAAGRNGSEPATEARASTDGEAVQLPLSDGAAPSEAPRRDLAQPSRDRSGQAHGGQAELGNRRGRRRRGRDRDRGEPVSGQEQPWQGELVSVKGLLDLREEGYGFLRTTGYLPSQKDVYVSVSQARRFALRKGDVIEGACRPAGASEKYPALVRIDTVGGMSPDEARQRPRFEDLTPLFPDEPLHLELPGDPANLTARIVDLISPVGKGQRGMIVSPPKAGKTTVMKQIAHSIEANNPDVHLIVLLVDERPEEVTDMRRSVKGEVIASTFDRPADEHTTVAELTIERAKRLVELGRDVVIILDGITRLARAYNLAQPATGRIMSGGVDSGALYPPKRFFGAARNIEEGGSLTILATALVETGSKMDEVIFEEFKGTGNMELRLDRRLAERRLYPAIDVNASSTRHEELLFDRSQLQQVWKLRRVLNALANEGNAAAGLELLIDKIRSTKSNDEFLAEIAKAPVPTA
ncbi:MAG: transcription termination factor Rho [Actinomycetota bacterium]|nr:transcription termination factor Rho [Actinomycetota bacterium]